MVFAVFCAPLTASFVFTLSSCVKIHMLTTGGFHPEAAASTLVVPDRLTVDGDAAELHLLGMRDSYFAMNVTVSTNQYAFAEYVVVWNWRTGFLASVSICHHHSYV